MTISRRSLSLAALMAVSLAALPQQAFAEIDNSAIGKPEFRKHERTFGLVYTLPEPVNEILAKRIGGLLRERLLDDGLSIEAQRYNIPHVTVVHIHNADPTTPEKMVKALPKPPGKLSIVLKNFYTTEAAKGAGKPWWLDLGIVKEGPAFEAMMAYNTVATAALAPLRDGPLPRVTGPVHAVMSEPGKELVRTVGVSGVNTVKDGKELRPHNPHNTLVYSTATFTPAVQASFDELAKQFNQILPDGIKTTFETVSIVELGFAGNVLREIYRIDLDTGAVQEIAKPN